MNDSVLAKVCGTYRIQLELLRFFVGPGRQVGLDILWELCEFCNARLAFFGRQYGCGAWRARKKRFDFMTATFGCVIYGCFWGAIVCRHDASRMEKHNAEMLCDAK